MRKTIRLALIAFFLMTCPAIAQEIYIHSGVTSPTGSSKGSYAWGAAYLQGLGDYMALSLTYLNEGHVQDHRRDGISPQFWGRYPLVDRKVSLAAGIGPYLYFDTERSSTGDSYSNTHGVGTMLSISATLYTTSRFLFQARGNWIWTPQNANTYVTTLGIGYQFEAPSKDAPQTLTDKTFQPRNNEVAFLAGLTVLNEYGGSGSSGAGAIEYRRSIGRYFAWSAGWLLEGGFISRNGPMTQIWLGQRFFDDRFSLGVGAGPYLGFDTSGGDVAKVNWLLSATASYMLHDHWAIRATWSRVTTGYDRDTDVVLSGITYRF